MPFFGHCSCLSCTRWLEAGLALWLAQLCCVRVHLYKLQHSIVIVFSSFSPSSSSLPSILLFGKWHIQFSVKCKSNLIPNISLVKVKWNIKYFLMDCYHLCTSVRFGSVQFVRIFVICLKGNTLHHATNMTNLFHQEIKMYRTLCMQHI